MVDTVRTPASLPIGALPDFIPVSPFRTASGALANLVPILGEQAAKPVPLATRDNALNYFNVVSGALSMSLAVSLGLGQIFKGAVGANEKAFYLDAMTYTDEYAQQTLPDGAVFATRWGIGIRMYLRVQDFSANANLNFGLVGAAVELKQASAQYEIAGVGIGIDGLQIVLSELDALGDFKYETYMKMKGAVIKKLAEYISTHRTTLQPQPVAVAVARSVDPLAAARSYYFAVKHIADRRSVSDALARAPMMFDRDVVRSAYATIAGVQNDAETPSRDAENRAEAWLSV